MNDEQKRRASIVDNFDQIADLLRRGQSVDLDTFVPDMDYKKNKMQEDIKRIENRKKL